MASWQAFPSLLPRAPLAFLSDPLNSLSLPFQTPATQARVSEDALRMIDYLCVVCVWEPDASYLINRVNFDPSCL